MSTTAAGRDTAVDLVRSLCVLGVIVLHALMVGVTVTAQGPAFENAAESGAWLVPVSWALQVMPLFFVIGGFAGITALRRRSTSAAAFAAARVHRLVRPALAVVATAGVLLALLTHTGVADDLVGVAGFRFSQPLWFLGVFLGCQALLPLMVRLHARYRVGALGALAAMAVLVDAARIITGQAAVGLVNMAFVWLALQQLGFFLSDGSIDRIGPRARALAATAAVAVLVLSFQSGFHSPDLIANLNPPTTALLLVGLTHTLLFSLARSRIAVVAERPVLAAFTAFVSQRTMTIYLWHMPVLLALAGVLALFAQQTGGALPAPGGAEWWLTRPAWVAVAVALTALLSVPLARIEASRVRRGLVRADRAAAGVVLGVAGVVVLLAAGTTPVTAAITSVLWLGALIVTSPRPVPAERQLPVHTLSAPARGRRARHRRHPRAGVSVPAGAAPRAARVARHARAARPAPDSGIPRAPEPWRW